MLRSYLLSLGREKRAIIKIVVICAAVSLAIIAAVYFTVMFFHEQLPVCVVRVGELDASTPAEAQSLLREQSEQFRELKSENEDCSFVWCGSNKLYLMRTEAIDLVGETQSDSFQKVRIFNSNGLKVIGYILDPCTDSKELDRISLEGNTELTFDSVSMAIRVGLKNGEIAYDNAAFLWENGSRDVIVVDKSIVTNAVGKLMTYIDDGLTKHRVFILDTVLGVK